MTEWFEQWFGEEYLQLYPHRDDADAARMIALVNSRIPLRNQRLLDLACGPGRHAEQLAGLGGHVVGFDLSMPLLRRARARIRPPLDLVRGDMRTLPFADASFHAVLNLFTSFGYFLDDAQHDLVLRSVAKSLVQGGTFVLDYFNADHVRRHLVAHEERKLGSRRIATERKLSQDGRFVVKEIHLMDEGRSFLERVRLFAPEDLAEMLQRAGFEVDLCVGDYDGAPISDTAPRAIFFAQRT